MNQGQTIQHMRVRNLELAYYKFGHGEPLLFLHGGRVRARTFTRLLTLLSENYTIIAPDIPGFGASDTPSAVWSFIDYAAFFEHFLKQLGIEQTIVMGYSMGGGIAANLAAVSPRVKQLVLVDASGIYRDKAARSHHDGRRLLFYATHLQYSLALTTLIRDYIQYAWKHRTDRAHMQQIREACFATRYDTNFLRIEVPTRLLWGSKDWIYPVAIAQEFQRHIAHATLKTVPENHDWPVYNPLLLSKLMV